MEKVTALFEVLKLYGFDAMTWLKKAAKSKTMLFATLLTIFGTIEATLGLFQGFLGAYYPHAVAVVGLIMAILRAVTTDSIADKSLDNTEGK